SAFERLNGMFAFALFDVSEDRLLLVRDRFGVKPLYYHRESSGLTFASTGAVIADEKGLQPDSKYLARGIRFNIYEGGDVSAYSCLSALAPGHFLDVRIGKDGGVAAEPKRYY